MTIITCSREFTRENVQTIPRRESSNFIKRMADMSTQTATGLRTGCASGTENVYNTFVEKIRDEDQGSRTLIQLRQIVKQALDHSGEQP